MKEILQRYGQDMILLGASASTLLIWLLVRNSPIELLYVEVMRVICVISMVYAALGYRLDGRRAMQAASIHYAIASFCAHLAILRMVEFRLHPPAGLNITTNLAFWTLNILLGCAIIRWRYGRKAKKGSPQ